MRTPAPSATVAINTLAQKKKREGVRVYNFSIGEPLLKIHPFVASKAVEIIDKGSAPYPPLDGIADLKEHFVAWFNKHFHTQFTKENIIVTCGGKFALFAYLFTELEPEDEVLIPAPYWVSYPEMVLMANGTPKIIPTTADREWKITGKDLEKYTSSKTKILILNNASNPTGILYSREELKQILQAAKKLHLKVLSDEVYSGLVYDGHAFHSAASFHDLSENVAVVQSCSKNFGMTGWRVGFLIADEKTVKKVSAVQGQTTTGTSSISQWAAVGALEKADQVTKYINEAMQKRRDHFIKVFKRLFGNELPPILSSIYVFIPLTLIGVKTTDSKAFCEELMEKYNIALVPGIAFGQEGYVRLTFSDTKKEIEEGLTALKKAVEGMHGK